MADLRSRDRRVAVAALAVAMLLAGCGADTASLAPATDPGRLTLPPSWQERELTEESIEHVKTELESELGDPGLVWIVAQLEPYPDESSFWALRYDDSRFAGSVKVKPLPAGWPRADDELEAYGQGSAPRASTQSFARSRSRIFSPSSTECADPRYFPS
jgi:hypothetical protein